MHDQFQNRFELSAQAVCDPIAAHDLRLRATRTKLNKSMAVHAERGEANTDYTRLVTLSTRKLHV